MFKRTIDEIKVKIQEEKEYLEEGHFSSLSKTMVHLYSTLLEDFEQGKKDCETLWYICRKTYLPYLFYKDRTEALKAEGAYYKKYLFHQSEHKSEQKQQEYKAHLEYYNENRVSEYDSCRSDILNALAWLYDINLYEKDQDGNYIYGWLSMDKETKPFGRI